MKDSGKTNALFQASHMMILVTYTALLVALTAETFLMSWEKWALIPIYLALGICWMLHIRQLFSERQRLTFYVVCMMLTIFFYGIHLTSAFDMALVMSVAIILCTTTGVKFFVTLCQITYYVTFAYDMFVMLRTEPEQFDSLVISRAALHVLLVLVAGWLARLVIDRWAQVLDHSKAEVDELTESTGRLNDFLSNVSHEIRTPINAVMGLTGICLEQTEDEAQRALLKEIYAAGERVTEQIGNILDYSDIDRHRLAVTTENYMLSSVLHDLAVKLKSYMRPGVELIIDVDPAIPAVMNTDVAKLERILWQLTTNALKFTKEGGVYLRITAEERDYGINLLLDLSDTGVGMTQEEIDRLFDGYYQADSGRTRSTGGLGLGMAIVSGFVTALNGFLHLESRPGEGTSVHVCLPQAVVDRTGCMSVRNREQLVLGAYLHFDKFPNPVVREYYNRMVANIVRGLGVQMHRVDNLENLRKLLETIRLTHLFVGPEEYLSDVDFMEQLAKTVTVSVVADGRFSLPAGSRAHVLEKPFYCFPVAVVLNRERGEAPADAFLYCRGVRVLVVDDEPVNLTVARDILRRYGMEITTASTGQEAVELCAREAFDIVFMDHMMPGMDGIEAMRRIRADNQGIWRNIPMVALTANAGSTARESFRLAGFDGFVAKPIDLAELERVIRAVLPKQMVTYEPTPYARPAGAARRAPGPAAPAEPEDAYAPVRALGVDIRRGLRFCENDEEFYRTVLLQFASDAAAKREEMERFCREADMPGDAIRIHALKSTAKLIGAEALSEKARALEEASKAGRAAEVAAGHGAAMADYAAIAQAILTAFGGAPKAAPPDRKAAPENTDVLEFGPDEEVDD